MFLIIFQFRRLFIPRMPKFIENYKLETIDKLSIDGMEHFIGKQNKSGKIFILKRFKPQNNFDGQLIAQNNCSSSNQQFFQKLTHQTLILKNIYHQSIPKCVRMLKTSNSIYFVWEFYPYMSLQEYLRKYQMKIEEKIQISVNILQTLAYIHCKKIAHCALTSQSIKIGDKRNVFLTNFKEAFLMESDSQKLRSEQQIIKKKYYQSLILRDIYDTAILLFQIFQFSKINPKFHVFSSSVESKLYNQLQCILEKKIGASSLDNLIKIFSEKGNIRQTACTETSDNFPSPKLIKSVTKRSPISRNQDLERSSQNKRNTVSCTKISLHNALKRAEQLRSEINGSRQSQKNLSSSQFKISVSKAKMISIESSPNKSVYRSANELKKIIANRKSINLMLKILNFLQKSKNPKVIYLIALKCEFYSDLNIKLIQECSSNCLEKKKMDFLKIVNSENIKTQDFFTKLKNSIKQIVQYDSPSELSIYETFEQAANGIQTQIIEQKLSNQIYQYLKKQLLTKSATQSLAKIPLQQNQQDSKQARTQAKSSKDLIITNGQRTVQILQNQPKKVRLDYQNYKFYFYLSLNLKYGSFDKFFYREQMQSQKFRVFEDDYFLPFENKVIPVEQIAIEVKSRVEKFGQKTVF